MLTGDWDVGDGDAPALQEAKQGLALEIDNLGKSLRWSLGRRLDRIDERLARMERQLPGANGNGGPGAPGEAEEEEEDQWMGTWGSHGSSQKSWPPAHDGRKDAACEAASEVPDQHPALRDQALSEESQVASLPPVVPVNSREQVSRSSIVGDISLRSPDGRKIKVFTPREAWLQESLKDAMLNMPYQPGYVPDLPEPNLVTFAATLVPTKYSRCVARPSSMGRLMWDLIGLLLIGYDTLAIPIQLAFEPREMWLTRIGFWTALIFWTLDIPFSFMTGYYVRGIEELSHRKIAKKYLRTWFTLDILLVGSDWFVVANSIYSTVDGRQGMPLARAGKTLRMLRILRSLRMLRVAKLKKLFNKVQDQITSQYMHILIYMLKLIIIIVCINHIIACSFYGLSYNIQGFYGYTWTERSRDEVGVDATDFYMYLTGLHWSLTQFTPASMEVVPRNAPERAFTVIVLMFALMVFSSFLSSITGAMTQLRQLSAVFDRNVSILRRYLQKREISRDLSVRILRYVEHQMYAQSEDIRERDVQLLEMLSKPLQEELVEENFSPMLTVHPFFYMYGAMDKGAMKQVCNKAVTMFSLSEGDVLFTEGVSDDKMYVLLKSSKLTYELQQRARPMTKTKTFFIDNAVSKKSFAGEGRVVLPGQWCCEAALWTKWVHLGTMKAIRVSDVVCIDCQAFQAVTLKHHVVTPGTFKYANAWVAHLNDQAVAAAEGGPVLSDVPGIFGDDIDCEEREILQAMAEVSFAAEAFRRKNMMTGKSQSFYYKDNARIQRGLGGRALNASRSLLHFGARRNSNERTNILGRYWSTGSAEEQTRRDSTQSQDSAAVMAVESESMPEARASRRVDNSVKLDNSLKIEEEPAAGRSPRGQERGPAVALGVTPTDSGLSGTTEAAAPVAVL